MMIKLKGDPKADVIIELLASNNDELIQNPFGNYAIQHAYDVNILNFIFLCTSLL